MIVGAVVSTTPTARLPELTDRLHRSRRSVNVIVRLGRSRHVSNTCWRRAAAGEQRRRRASGRTARTTATTTTPTSSSRQRSAEGRGEHDRVFDGLETPRRANRVHDRDGDWSRSAATSPILSIRSRLDRHGPVSTVHCPEGRRRRGGEAASRRTQPDACCWNWARERLTTRPETARRGRTLRRRRSTSWKRSRTLVSPNQRDRRRPHRGATRISAWSRRSVAGPVNGDRLDGVGRTPRAAKHRGEWRRGDDARRVPAHVLNARDVCHRSVGRINTSRPDRVPPPISSAPHRRRGVGHKTSEPRYRQRVARGVIDVGQRDRVGRDSHRVDQRGDRRRATDGETGAANDGGPVPS